jgi:hypothetical protein
LNLGIRIRCAWITVLHSTSVISQLLQLCRSIADKLRFNNNLMIEMDLCMFEIGTD